MSITAPGKSPPALNTMLTHSGFLGVNNLAPRVAFLIVRINASFNQGLEHCIQKVTEPPGTSLMGAAPSLRISSSQTPFPRAIIREESLSGILDAVYMSVS